MCMFLAQAILWASWSEHYVLHGRPIGLSQHSAVMLSNDAAFRYTNGVTKNVFVANNTVYGDLHLMVTKIGCILRTQKNHVDCNSVHRADCRSLLNGFRRWKGRQDVIEGENLEIPERIDVEGRRATAILPLNRKSKTVFFTRLYNFSDSAIVDTRRTHPRSAAPKGVAGVIGSVPSRIRRFSCFPEGPYQQKSAEKTESSARPRREYLVFGGIGSPYLGVQIVGIVFAAFGFSALTGYSLFRRFNDSDRHGRWLLVSLASSICGLFFWGWGWAGNPLSAWGLAP